MAPARPPRYGAAMDPAVVEARSTELLELGYTVFEALYDREWVAGVRADIEEIHAEAGRPPCYAAAPRGELIEGVFACPAGLAVPGFLRRASRWAGSTVHEDVVGTLRRTLGADMVLEVAGCVISDSSRPFFGWHNHVGGHDDGIYRATGSWPPVARPRRVMTLTYLQDLDEDAGPLLVFPRRVGEPSDPPRDPELERWPGQIELRPRAGSLVIIDECTWHAVLPMRAEGLRLFVGLAYAARDAEVGGWAHASVAELAELPDASDLLRSVLR